MVFALVALFVVGIGARFALKERAVQKREAGYESALGEYQRALKPGMTREEVEDYLAARNSSVLHICCVEPREIGRHSWDDLIKIGHEDPPWFCGENNVYVALQFADHIHPQSGFEINDDDLDTLKAITLLYQPEDCL